MPKLKKTKSDLKRIIQLQSPMVDVNFNQTDHIQTFKHAVQTSELKGPN